MKKKVIATLIAILAMGNTVFAAEQINVEKNQVKIAVNGKTVEADNFLYKGTTYVPLRAVSENLNGSVNYDSATKTANISSNAPTATSSNYDPNVFLMWQSSRIINNADGLFYTFCLDNPYMAKEFTDDDFTDTMETFDAHVSTAVEIYNSVYDLEIVELYPAVEELQDLAVTLNAYGNDLIDMKFKGSTSIDSKYNEKLDIVTTKYLNIIDSIDKYQTELLDENTK